ncbi:MAG: hypothetical protein H0T68_08805 [Gemmatimonadales bacterium]|nr:hypothetical protein [Gemmatimonadales bacterium]
MIAASLPLFAAATLIEGFWPVPLGLFLAGGRCSSSGIISRESRRSFFHDWRFLLVALRCRPAKVRGRA